MSRSRIHADGRVIALFATLTVAIAACHAGSVAPSTTASALHGVESIAPTLHRSDLAVLIGDAGACHRPTDQNFGPVTLRCAAVDVRRPLGVTAPRGAPDQPSPGPESSSPNSAGSVTTGPAARISSVTPSANTLKLATNIVARRCADWS